MTETGDPAHGSTDASPADVPADGPADVPAGGQGADATVLTGPSVTAAPGDEAAATAEPGDAGSSETEPSRGAGQLEQGGPGTPIVSDPAITAPPADYTAGGVPSLDFVRNKIEGRYATSLGATELAEDVIPEVKSAREQAAAREEAARDKLEAIRRSMRGESDS